MSIYNASMPDGKRVYNARMPDGVRSYNVVLPGTGEYLRDPCKFIPYYSVADEVFNRWYESNAISVAENGSQWDIADNTGSYETLDQMSEVVSVEEFQLHHLSIQLDKELVDDHFFMLQTNQYINFSWSAPPTPVEQYAYGFNLVTGAVVEILNVNSGELNYYVEDLGSQWRFIMEFQRDPLATHILTQMYPAGGTTFPQQTAAATGSITVDCIHGYLYEYTP